MSEKQIEIEKTIEKWIEELEDALNQNNKYIGVDEWERIEKISEKYGIKLLYAQDICNLPKEVKDRLLERFGYIENLDTLEECEDFDYLLGEWDTFIDGSFGGIGLFKLGEHIIYVEGTWYRRSDYTALEYEIVYP